MICNGTNGKNDKRPPRRDLFSAKFHADHASSDDLGFGGSDGDFSWATEQLEQEDSQRRALHQQIQDKFKIKPKVQKINDDDESWFSEASDVEGSAQTSGSRKGKKKRRKAGAPGTKSPSGVSDDVLLQHPNSKGGDDASSDEENLFEFAADFGAFGNGDVFAGDLTQSSANDDFGFESSHNNRSDPFFPDSLSANGGPIHSSPSTASFSSNASGKKSASSSIKGSHKSFTMLPVPSSPKTLKRMQSCSSFAGSLPDMDLSEGADDNEGLFQATFIDNAMEQESKSQQHAHSKVRHSLTAAAAAMNKQPFEKQGTSLEPTSAHSTHSSNMSSAKKMYMMKPKSAFDPLSSSDHGPRLHSRGTMKTSQRTKLVRQTSDPVILEESATSLNASSLLHGSSSLEASGSLQASQSLQDGSAQASHVSLHESQLGLHASQPLQASQTSFGVSQLGLQASRSTFHASQPMQSSSSGTPGNSRGMHSSQPIQSFQSGDKPRRKVVRKVVRKASGESSVSGPTRRRRVPSHTNSMSGSSDDGGKEGTTRKVVRRRPSSNTNSMSGSSDDGGEKGTTQKIMRRRLVNTALSGSQHRGAPVKKKMIRRRASDGGAFGKNDTDDDNVSVTASSKSGVIRERRRVSMQAKLGSSEIAKVLQVGTAAIINMAKLQTEIKQGAPQRKLKPKGASQTSSTLDLAIQKASHPAKRVLKRQKSANSLPAVSSGQLSAGTETGRKPVAQSTDDITEARTPDEAKQVMRASMVALDQHMVKRRPVRKPGGPSGSASLAGHEMSVKKKKAPIRSGSSDLASKLAGGGPRYSGSASVAGDQVTKHLVRKKLFQGDRKPLSSDAPRPVKTQQRQIQGHSSFNGGDAILRASCS
uniref:Uncharacterized protein n=1 Tax=Amphora coffeiformis TaxID=265554 RepID=A0A7S3P867_9STRA|mmetsp:Transcript_4119/g.8313  ORF Transcript_4119/g.8313 Transcript_4119/m.8313 type:complete len:871 (+) Transcript_4119:256-2868(+)|eukprot:scaffold24022_cov168-Amphora_coffeaeformis.AAC.10